MDDTLTAEAGTVDNGTIDGSATATAPSSGDTRLIEDELLVEEISIDGMCGVY